MMSELTTERSKKAENGENDCHRIADLSQYLREVCRLQIFPQTVFRFSLLLSKALKLL
jgi:hypothetical protein